MDGLRALIVEDETLIAILMEETLRDLGFSSVTTASTLDAAIVAVDTVEFDVAVLDVNLGHGVRSYPVARMLQANCRPFMFVTGYSFAGGIEEFPGIPVLTKPYLVADLEANLRTILEPRA